MAFATMVMSRLLVCYAREVWIQDNGCLFLPTVNALSLFEGCINLVHQILNSARWWRTIFRMEVRQLQQRISRFHPIVDTHLITSTYRYVDGPFIIIFSS